MLAGEIQVPELIAGLKNLGCSRTTGEDQTVCVMSDSFDARYYASDLRDSGDLPEVENLKVRDCPAACCAAANTALGNIVYFSRIVL